MDVLDPFGAIGEWLGGMCGMRRPAPEESGGSSAAWLRAPLPDDDRTPEPEPETTGAELLRSLLASMLPTVRAAACAALYDMASGGEPIVLGPLLRLFVERKVKRLGVSGAGMGLHLGPVGAVAPDAPLVEAEIVSKLEVEVIAVQIVDGSAPPTQHGIFDGWLPSQAASSQAEAADASSLVVDAELVIHLHLSGDADGQNALDFVLRPLGVATELRHVVLHVDTRLWISGNKSELRVAFLSAPEIDLDLEIDVLCLNLPDFMEDALPAFVISRVCAAYTAANPLVIPLGKEPPAASAPA